MAALSSAMAALTIANGFMNYRSNRNAGAAARAEGDFQAGVLGLNADLADRAAEDAILRGNEAANRSRAGTRALAGAQRATLAAQGIDINSGTALDLQSETQDLGELDILTISNNAQREAYGFKVEAFNDRQQAKLARMSARNKEGSANNASISTLLTTGAQLYDQYNRSKN